jgi:hypothetical protein
MGAMVAGASIFKCLTHYLPCYAGSHPHPENYVAFDVP